jgi:death-on-curing protein
VKEPVWIDERDALALHDRLLALHGGAVGLRDDGLLKSALARPQQHFAYAESADIVGMAAAYTWGIVRNHPFVDGNKRTGFVVGVLFLELNGYRFNASEEDAAQMVLELASGNLDEAGYIAFLRAHGAREKMKQHFRAQQRESLVEGRIARDDEKNHRT